MFAPVESLKIGLYDQEYIGGLRVLEGQRLSAVVVTLYKFKLASGLVAFIESLITPKA